MPIKCRSVLEYSPDHTVSPSSICSQAKNDFMYAMEWATPETLRGQDDSVQLCANPNCSPFPYCCRTELVEDHDIEHL